MTKQLFRRLIWASLSLFMVSPIPSSANTAGPPTGLGVGIMAGVSTSPYKEDDGELRAFPAVSYVSEQFFIRGPFAGLRVYTGPQWKLNLTAGYTFEEDAFEESPALRGMDRRDGTLMMGLDANMTFFENWRLDAVVQTDVLGRHDGQTASLVLSQKRRLYRTILSPGVGVAWHSPNFNDFYFGVDDSEIRPGRRAYRPGSSVEWFLNLTVLHPVNRSVSVVVNSKLEFLSNTIQDSPIVDEDVAASAFVSVNYTF